MYIHTHIVLRMFISNCKRDGQYGREMHVDPLITLLISGLLMSCTCMYVCMLDVQFI